MAEEHAFVVGEKVKISQEYNNPDFAGLDAKILQIDGNLITVLFPNGRVKSFSPQELIKEPIGIRGGRRRKSKTSKRKSRRGGRKGSRKGSRKY